MLILISLICRNCHPPPTSSFSPSDALVPQEYLAQPPGSVVTWWDYTLWWQQDNQKPCHVGEASLSDCYLLESITNNHHLEVFLRLPRGLLWSLLLLVQEHFVKSRWLAGCKRAWRANKGQAFRYLLVCSCSMFHLCLVWILINLECSYLPHTIGTRWLVGMDKKAATDGTSTPQKWWLRRQSWQSALYIIIEKNTNLLWWFCIIQNLTIPKKCFASLLRSTFNLLACTSDVDELQLPIFGTSLSGHMACSTMGLVRLWILSLRDCSMKSTESNTLPTSRHPPKGGMSHAVILDFGGTLLSVCNDFWLKVWIVACWQGGNSHLFSGVSLVRVLWECFPFVLNVMQLLTLLTRCHLVMRHAWLASAPNKKRDTSMACREKCWPFIQRSQQGATHSFMWKVWYIGFESYTWNVRVFTSVVTKNDALHMAASACVSKQCLWTWITFRKAQDIDISFGNSATVSKGSQETWTGPSK